MRSQSPLVTFHPELFQVKSERKEEKLRADVFLPSREKTPKAKVVLDQTEGTFYLNRATQAQVYAILRGNVLK